MMSQSHSLHSILSASLDFLPNGLNQNLPFMKLCTLILQGIKEFLGGEDSPLKERMKVLIEHGVINCQGSVLLGGDRGQN